MLSEQTIKAIQEEVAREKGYPNWKEMYDFVAREGQRPDVVAQLIEGSMNDVINKAATLYAEQLEEVKASYEALTLQFQLLADKVISKDKQLEEVRKENEILTNEVERLKQLVKTLSEELNQLQEQANIWKEESGN